MRTAILSRRFVANYLSTLAFVGLAWWIVRDLSQFHRNQLQARWQFGSTDVDFALPIHALIAGLIGLYAVLLIPYYLRYPWLHSKASVFLQGIWLALRRTRRPPSRVRARLQAMRPWRLPVGFALSPAAQQAGLTLLLKFFFAPLMLNWCLAHASDMTHAVAQLVDGIHAGLRGRALFDTWLFWAAFQLILFVDTFLFTIGYIVEIPALRNRIRSVDPTFFGWAICLACYPPFNDFTTRFFAWQSADFPQFQGDAAHFAANTLLLTALGVYSWATVALGFKASNLTNRGIVGRGPYAVVRHPAYVAKNFAWWIGALPLLGSELASANYSGFAYSLLSLAGWTTIYALRAITEERHLLMGNNGYAEYMQRVKWRFIPRVF
jgi:protein-S-isoprenylcysteine O-methyltransferase Ste14